MRNIVFDFGDAIVILGVLGWLSQHLPAHYPRSGFLDKVSPDTSLTCSVVGWGSCSKFNSNWIVLLTNGFCRDHIANEIVASNCKGFSLDSTIITSLESYIWIAVHIQVKCSHLHLFGIFVCQDTKKQETEKAKKSK